MLKQRGLNRIALLGVTALHVSMLRCILLLTRMCMNYIEGCVAQSLKMPKSSTPAQNQAQIQNRILSQPQAIGKKTYTTLKRKMMRALQTIQTTTKCRTTTRTTVRQNFILEFSGTP